MMVSLAVYCMQDGGLNMKHVIFKKQENSITCNEMRAYHGNIF
jgi:hypothetical protein